MLEESAAALPQLPPPLPTRRLSPPTSLRSQQQPSVAPPAIELLTDVEPPRTRAFPVLLLTATRGEMLNRTLRSLLAVRGLNASEVFVVQDGTDESVARVVRWNGLRLVQHETPPGSHGCCEEAASRSAARLWLARTNGRSGMRSMC